MRFMRLCIPEQETVYAVGGILPKEQRNVVLLLEGDSLMRSECVYYGRQRRMNL